MVKLKQRPEDFQVREVLDYVEDRDGEYFIHRLRKSKCDTVEAISRLSKHLRVDRDRFAFAGLKDRQGQTEQWISILGDRFTYKGGGIDLRFFGRAAEPITSKQSRGNDFKITLRDVFVQQIPDIERGVKRISRDGYANYFDDQRFGSIKHGQGFPMRDVAKGNYERALKSMIARPSRHAITGDVRLKKLLAGAWGDWERCDRIARGPLYRRLFRHLMDYPDDFRGALIHVPQRQRLIHAFAYQSYLWNRACDLVLGKLLHSYRRIEIRTEPSVLTSWSRLNDGMREEIANLHTPLPGPDGEGGSKVFESALDRVLVDADLTLSDLADHGVPGMVLKEEPRRLMIVPRNLRILEVGNDEENRRMKKVTIAFGLPRGAYATMMVKHLLAEESERGGRQHREHREHRDHREHRGPRSRWDDDD